MGRAHPVCPDARRQLSALPEIREIPRKTAILP
jgi:hypothetical protein